MTLSGGRHIHVRYEQFAVTREIYGLVSDITDFKKKLKTHLFKLSFDLQWMPLWITFLSYLRILLFTCVFQLYQLGHLH